MQEAQRAPWYALPAGAIGVVAAALLLWRLALMTGLSGDVFWQLAAGRWMWAHHRLLTTDVFSYTVHGRPWFTEEWGYEVLLAGLVQALGPVAFWLLSAGVGTLTVFMVAGVAARMSDWTWAGGLALLVGICLLLFQRDRPQEFSYAFFVGLAALVRWLRRSPWAALAVAALMGIWANLHGSFLLGLAVLVVTAAAAPFALRFGRLFLQPWERPWQAMMGVVFGASATLANPHGAALWVYAFRVSTNPVIGSVIEEWQPPNFHDPVLLVLVLVPLGVTVLALAVSTRPVPLLGLAVAGALFAATLDSVRFLPYFELAWALWIAEWRPWTARGVRHPVTWVALVMLGVLLMGGKTYPPGTPASDQPVAAVLFLRHLAGRVFSTYRWGDYLVGAGIPVFIDGRTDLYAGTGILGTYLAVADLSVDPDVVFRDYDVQFVLWPPHTALATFLLHDAQWRVVWDTPSALIFMHRGAWASVGRT